MEGEDNPVLDEIDMVAIAILLSAPLMSEYEMKNTLCKLKRIAKKKSMANYKNINEILDYWADKAYQITMKY
ncbi:hypothetical protein KKP91_01005 [Methanothermococcus sp. SCGC AD-155-M21]|nr:hypothetical protein [Methanothermococcus sp. SCGC AD-155-M21]